MTQATASEALDLGPIPTVVVERTTLDDIIRWTAAIDDYSPIHYDAAVAADRGFDGPVVNGPWKSAMIMRLLTTWLAGRGEVATLTCRYEHADIVGTQLTFGGAVTGSRPAANGLLVDCDVWVDNDRGVRSVTGHASVEVRGAVAPAPGTLPLAELRTALGDGAVVAEFTYRVDPNDIARFRSAVSGVNRPPSAPLPAVGDVAPPTFYAALDPVERRDLQLEQILDALPYPKVGGGNAFNEVEYVRPLVAGDVITVRTSYEDVYERDGRAGRLLFRVRVNDLIDADDERVATTRMGHVLAFDLGTTA